MHEALLIGLGFVVVGLVAGWILRRRTPRLAHVCHFGALALVRILAAVALGWAIARLLDHRDALHIVAAVVLCLPALWSLLSGALMSYTLLTGGEQAPRSMDSAH